VPLLALLLQAAAALLHALMSWLWLLQLLQGLLP
jgi:hypothetical protein